MYNAFVSIRVIRIEVSYEICIGSYGSYVRVLVTGHTHAKDDATKRHLDYLAVSGCWEGSEFRKLDFNFLKRENILKC